MAICEISVNLLVQYILVAIIIAAAVARIVWKFLSSRKKGTGGCCGCTLADTCAKAKTQNLKKTYCECNTSQSHSIKKDTKSHEDNQNLEQ